MSKLHIGMADWQGWKDASENEPAMDAKTFRKYFGFRVDAPGATVIDGGDTLWFAYHVYVKAYEKEKAGDYVKTWKRVT